MSLKPAPLRAPMKDPDTGQMPSVWREWFNNIRRFIGNAPFPLQSYTVSNAPDASAYEGHIIYVSDEAGGKTIAFSDGSDWRRVQDRAIIST